MLSDAASSAYAPRPWEIDDGDSKCFGVFDANGAAICYLSEAPSSGCGLRPEDRSHAHLIAAAPELLESLEAYDPELPPALDGETEDQYTDRLTGADGGTPPYPEHRNRQCSIGYHDECSDPCGRVCKCPCHRFDALRSAAVRKAKGRARASRGRLMTDSIRLAVRQLRASTGDTQQAFAERVGLSVRSISRYEIGRTPDARAVGKLLKIAAEYRLPEIEAVFLKALNGCLIPQVIVPDLLAALRNVQASISRICSALESLGGAS